MNLRREIRKEFEKVILRNDSTVSEVGIQSDYWQIVINELADAALEVSAIAKRATDENQGEYNTELFRGDWREYPDLSLPPWQASAVV